MPLCQFCSYDSSRGVMPACTCAYAALLGCGGRPACLPCANAHSRIGKFFTELEKSAAPTRANSVRLKLFGVLRDVIVSRQFPNRDYCLEVLRELDVFGPNFSATIKHIVTCIPLNTEFAEEVAHQARRAQAAISIEKAARDLELVRANEIVGEYVEQVSAEIAETEAFKARIRATFQAGAREIRKAVTQAVSR